jgi:hypothetical protein
MSSRGRWKRGTSRSPRWRPNIEPNITGTGALLVPSTGIVDYSAVARRHVRAGTGAEVIRFEQLPAEVRIRSAGGKWSAAQVVVCAGLQADRLARLAGLDVDFRIIPFRGEYYTLPPSRAGLVRHLIYPVPDPSVPFLGVHLTLMIDGSITVGPNAVLGLGRESYRRGAIDARDIADYLAFPGFWRMSRQHWRSGVAELHRSLSGARYLADCRKYCRSLHRRSAAASCRHSSAGRLARRNAGPMTSCLSRASACCMSATRLRRPRPPLSDWRTDRGQIAGGVKPASGRGAGSIRGDAGADAPRMIARRLYAGSENPAFA